MKSEVLIKFDIEGFHNYPEAPYQVHFLSYIHRHTFVISCGYKVTDLNREQEIFICRDEVKKYIYMIYGNPCKFNNNSCEMIAENILNQFSSKGMIWCEVWEEETGGAKCSL
jgi:hypothetical protein